MMLRMRTTVTLDEDVERLLRDAMHRDRRSFKESLNQALRAGLQGDRPAPPPFVVQAWPMQLRPGVDPARLRHFADELEDEARMRRMRQAEEAEVRRQKRQRARRGPRRSK